MPRTKTKAKAKTNVAVLTGVILAGLGMFALAGFGFLKTEIEPSIAKNLSGWIWNFESADNYNFDSERIEIIENDIDIINNSVQLKEDQDLGTISDKSSIAYSCYPHPAVGFYANSEGDLSFQISKDDLNWYYWNEDKWYNAQELEQSNNAEEIDEHIRDFWPRSLNQFYFRAILDSPEDKLKNIEISCDETTLSKILLYPGSL